MKPFSTWVSTGVVLLALLGGLGYIGFHVSQDLSNVTLMSIWPWVLLCTALAIALGFEFVNGFHDTANAVATVIYTHSLDPNIAVVWSGMCNLIGVLVSTGTVAYSVITLLPVELILKVSYGAGFAMVFALLIAAIIWNIGTWWLGLPASSSHTMVGSIIGVGVANQIHIRRHRYIGRGFDAGRKCFPGAADLADHWLLCRRPAAAAGKGVYSHEMGQGFCCRIRCEPQKATLDHCHHSHYRDPWSLYILVGCSYAFRALWRAGDGSMEAHQLFHVLEPPGWAHRHDVPGRHRGVVPHSLVCQDRYQRWRCAVYRAPGRRAATVADPCSADLHLQRRELCAWVERRPKGHGPHHADPHRHGAYGLCSEPRCAAERRAGFRRGIAAGRPGD